MNEWVYITALDVLNKILGYVLSLSISFKMVSSDIWCCCCCCFVSGSLKCELITFFKIVFCFLCKFGIGGACAVCNYDLLHTFPKFHTYNTTNTLCNPWTAWKSDRATKIIVTLLFNDGFEKKKNSYWRCLYSLLRYSILWVILIHFFPGKIPEVRARSFWLTL